MGLSTVSGVDDSRSGLRERLCPEGGADGGVFGSGKSPTFARSYRISLQKV